MSDFKKVERLKCPICGTELFGANLTIAILRGKCNQCQVDYYDLVIRLGPLLKAVDALVEHWNQKDGPSFEYTNVQTSLIHLRLNNLRRIEE